MLVRAPYALPFFLAICWIKHNDAVPLVTYSSVASRIQDILKEQNKGSENNWNETPVHSRAKRRAILLGFDSDRTIKNLNGHGSQEDKVMNYNQNVNVNMNIMGLHNKPRNKRPKLTTDPTPLSGYQSLEDIKEEQSANCANSRKKDQRYTSSFVGNITGNLSVDKEFDKVFGNNTKAKRTSSILEGEDITLCWIETTTIKENKTVRPPNRLVIREYTISFENSATIPDRYLECKRLEGELAANDSEIGKTTLFEVIDENTKISRVVNFTSISQVGDIVVWQHKRVKCGVGPVVTKNIIEWNDGTKNPKKRVEIKISPKLHQLTATKTEEESCMESGEEVKDGSTDIVEFCESTEGSTPEVITTTDGISMEYETSTTEKIITESTSGESESEEKISLPINVSSLSTSAFEETESTTETYFTTFEKLDCEMDLSDSACITQELTKPSSKELSTKLSITTEATAKSEVSTSSVNIKIPELQLPELSTLIDEDKTTEKEPSSENIRFTESSSVTSEKHISETTLGLVSKKTILPATDILESLKTQPTDKITTPKDVQTKITTSRSVTNESTPEEVSSFVESTSKKLNKIDYEVTSSGESTIRSSEISTEQDTTAVPLFTEFAKESETPGEILDKISEPSTLIESTTATLEESSGTKKTTIGLGTTTKKEIITTARRTSSAVNLTTLSSTTDGEIDYSCENSEDCIYVGSSEGCEFGNCGNTTVQSCESEVCSEEEITENPSTFDTSTSPRITTQPSSVKSTEVETQHTDATTISSREDEQISVTNDNVFTTTMESRRSTIASRHKLTLKIKILLEHVDENKEKHNLVEVEKQLSLNEDPYYKHSDLMKQLKSLNNSINTEAINALLNYTSLGNLTRAANLISTANNNLKQLEFSNADSEDAISVEQTTSGQIGDKYENSQYSEYDQETALQRRRRRSLKEVFNSETRDLNRLENIRQHFLDSDDSAGFKYQIDNLKKNISDENKMEVARQTLPGIQEDVSHGLQHMVARLTKKNLMNDVEKIASTDLLGVIANPKDNRIHSRRRRATMEEVGHWSNERIRQAPMGGRFRSFTEFILYKILS